MNKVKSLYHLTIQQPTLRIKKGFNLFKKKFKYNKSNFQIIYFLHFIKLVFLEKIKESILFLFYSHPINTKKNLQFLFYRLI